MIELAVSISIIKASITAFEYRSSAPSALFPYNVAAMDQTLASSISNPAYLPSISYPYLAFSGSKPYTLSELNCTTIRAGYSKKNVGMQVAWNRFGFPCYWENIAEGSLGYMPIKYISLGLGVSYYHLSIKTSELSFDQHLFDGRISLLIQPTNWLQLSFFQDNAVSIFLPKREDLLFPEWSAGISLKPFQGFALIYNLNRTHYEFVNSISTSVTLLPYLNIRAGYSRESLTFSMSLSIVYKFIAACYGLRYHPHLGLTHSIGITLSISNIEMTSLYFKPGTFKFIEKNQMRKVNINHCSLNDLKKIPGLDPDLAERIIKYRKIFGPVSRKSLFQIGMDQDEVNRIIPYISGLSDSESNNRKKRHKRKNISTSRQRHIFNRLLKLNIRASIALEITELTAKNKMDELEHRINTLDGITEETKNSIKKICGVPFQ